MDDCGLKCTLSNYRAPENLFDYAEPCRRWKRLAWTQPTWVAEVASTNDIAAQVVGLCPFVPDILVKTGTKA